MVAILELAFRDLEDAEHVGHTKHQAEAAAFIESEDFEIFCDWLQWDAERVRAALLHAKDEVTQKQRHSQENDYIASSASCAWGLIGLQG